MIYKEYLCAINSKTGEMASSKDFENIWANYQNILKTKNVSIVDYCQRNGIVYAQFEKWYRKHVSGVSIVPLPDTDVQTDASSVIPPESSSSQAPYGDVTARVNYVNIEFSNGLKVCQKSIAYEQLRMLVEKLEGLC